MKKIILSIVFAVALVIGCGEDKETLPDLGDVSFVFDVNQFRSSSPNGRIESPSGWNHIFEPLVNMKITNVINGRTFNLSFNPNSGEVPKITLPYASYRYDLSSTSDLDIVDFLPFTISGEFIVSNEINEIEINAKTDYGLFTFLDDNIESVLINSKQLSFKNGTFIYGYIKEGLKSIEITETVFSDVISREITVNPYDHYHFVLKFIQGDVSFVQLTLQPFNYIHENIEIAFSKDFEEGTPIIALAEPKEGFIFDFWEVNGERIERSNELKFNMPSNDIKITAYFKKL